MQQTGIIDLLVFLLVFLISSSIRLAYFATRMEWAMGIFILGVNGRHQGQCRLFKQPFGLFFLFCQMFSFVLLELNDFRSLDRITMITITVRSVLKTPGREPICRVTIRFLARIGTWPSSKTSAAIKPAFP